MTEHNVWNEVPGGYEGITSDGLRYVWVSDEEMQAEREDCIEEDWPTPDDYAADFNGKGAAIVKPSYVLPSDDYVRGRMSEIRPQVYSSDYDDKDE